MTKTEILNNVRELTAEIHDTTAKEIAHLEAEIADLYNDLDIALQDNNTIKVTSINDMIAHKTELLNLRRG